MSVVDVFAGVFFHVDARQAHALRRAVHLDVDVAVGADGQLVLANLIALGQIRDKNNFCARECSIARSHSGSPDRR